MKENVSVDLLISRDDAAGLQQIPETILEKAGLKGKKDCLSMRIKTISCSENLI